MAKETKKAEYGFIANLWIFLCGISNFFISYAIYYAMYNTDREVALKFRNAANVGIIVWLVMLVVSIFVDLPTSAEEIANLIINK